MSIQNLIGCYRSRDSVWFSLITWSRSSPASLMITERIIYREREQLICIVIWAYQCTRWNRFKLVCTGLGKIDPAIFRIWGRRLNDYLYKLSRDWSVCSLSHDWSIFVNSNFAPPSKATPHDFAVPSYPRDCFVSGSIQLHQT